MSILDAELPYSLIDMSFSLIMALFGAILMCISAGYFAATMPPVILIVWGVSLIYLYTVMDHTKHFGSITKVLSQNVATNASSGPRS